MKIKIIEDCAANAEHLSAGQSVDLPEPVAIKLIGLGRAKKDDAPPVNIQEIQVREPVVESRDPETPSPKIRKSRHA